VSTIDDERPLGRQAERSERSTEALLDAAAELIAEVGLVAMTFAALGKRAGYSRGLVTARFGSKAGLVDALISRVWHSLHDAGVVPMSQTSPALSSLTALIDGIHTIVHDNPRDMKAMVALLFQAPGADPELKARMRAFSEDMRAEIGTVLSRGMADGSIRSGLDVSAEAELIAGALHGISYQWLLDPDQVDAARAYATLRTMLVERYRAT